MTTTTPPAALIPAAPVFTNTERLALAGFLADYGGLTREAYELDLRQYASWRHQHHLRLFQARRADIECFARDLETRGRARATITRRLCLVAAGLGSPVEHALISLLALNGLLVSEAAGVNIEVLGIERGHRTLVITRKGGKVVTIPLAPRTARAIDLAVGERVDGPVFLAPDGQRLDRASGPAAAAGLGALCVAAMGGCHPLAKRIGAWPAVVAVTAAAVAAAELVTRTVPLTGGRRDCSTASSPAPGSTSHPSVTPAIEDV